MTTEKRLLGVNPSGGDKPNVEDVFSTYLYDGTGSTQTITNGIDLDGEGGLVWIKRRDGSDWHNLYDTERGARKYLNTNGTGAQGDGGTSYLTSFNFTGFSIGGGGWTGQSGADYASWTFRKAPKFFDVVTYTGDGTAGREIAHDLGCDVGMIFVKKTSGSAKWCVYHKSRGIGKELHLNKTDAETSYGDLWSGATDTTFTVSANNNVNYNGDDYVAYIFAHDPDGEDDDGMIACGSYTGNGSSDGPEITLGWEPQYVMVKCVDNSSPWTLWDVMRGLANNGTSDDRRLKADTSDSESNSPLGHPTSTGLKITGTNGDYNTSGDDYIYMAIRGPMMKEPESATDVFAIDIRTSAEGEGKYVSGFPVDFSLANNYDSSGNTFAGTRLTNAHLQTNSTVSESPSATDYTWDNSDGVGIGESGAFFGGSTNNINWMWKRAKGFLDVVAYTGTGSARVVSHSLGVAPELMIFKRRDNNAYGDWHTYVGSLGNNKYLKFNGHDASTTANSGMVNYTDPTDTEFTVGDWNSVNSSSTHVAYLFASLDGISKVGSYTGNGSSQTIDCGFSNGARFVLIKRTDASGDWMLWDSVRGLSASGGEATYTSVGTHNWTAPAGVTSVSVVAVGGGGAGGMAGAAVGGGGGGGSLSYKNNIPVTAGNTYSVCVGGGGALTNNSVAGGSGGDSYFINNTTLLASGGSGGGGGGSGAGHAGTGGVLSQYSDGGGAGGNGASNGYWDSGGGGAGGYSGKGGDGKATSNGKAGNGGAGGGGNKQRGGGVGLYGEGASGASSSGQGNAGSNGNGGSYGAGGASWAVGYQGAVRIIWSGSSRSFPSTGTGSADEPSLPLNTTSAETSSDSIDSNSLGFDIKQDATTNANVSSATYIYLAIA